MPLTLPVLPSDRPLRLTPTDVTQFVRLEQCERYLRFRLAEQAGQDFMGPYGVVPRRITPLLSLSGHNFEQGVEDALARNIPATNFAAGYGPDPKRPDNNGEVVETARTLPAGRVVLLFQP